MTTRSSLAELLADPGSSAPAIISTSPSVVVSYKALAEQIERLAGQLRSSGLKTRDCVAIVLTNSLEFMVIFLALTRAGLVAAPLNPADKPDEIRFFIEDTQARAVVTEGANVTVKEAVAGLALPIWHPRVDSPGVVEIPELPPASRASFGAPNPDDVALFAYTSGTTDRPSVYRSPTQCALVIAEYRGALRPDLGRLRSGSFANVSWSRACRSHVIDPGVRRLRHSTAALFRL
jgi:acyl-CoA synthetase (AMP-forming)/AMP-acid ligase II